MPDLLTQTTGAEVEATVPVNQKSVQSSREKRARRAVIGTPLVLIRRLTAQTSVASLAILAVFLPVIDGIFPGDIPYVTQYSGEDDGRRFMTRIL
jgi:hypothetical protein